MMTADTQMSSSPDSNRTLFRLLLLAAASVIVVSLVGIGIATGLIPRFGAEVRASEQTGQKQVGTGSTDHTNRPAQTNVRHDSQSR